MNAKRVIGMLTVLLLSCSRKPDDAPVIPPPEPYVPEIPPVEDITTYQVTNPYVQKFVEEVTYPDRDFSYSKVSDYPGGGPGEADIPPSVSLEWEADASAGPLTLKVWEKDWSREYPLPQEASGYDLVNLVPGVRYSFSVTGQVDGKAVAHGEFLTCGSVHQVFFPPKVRNARDLGGWKTTDGKTVAFRKIYRGGRVDGVFLDDDGRAEFRAAGIKAELDLRENETVPESSPIGPDIVFFAPGFPSGYREMLEDYQPGVRESFEFIVDCLRKDRPVYFHCAAGRDRTGTLAILLLGLLGVPEGEISKDYELTYFSPSDWSMWTYKDPEHFYHTRDREDGFIAAFNFLWDKGEWGTFADRTAKYLLKIGARRQDIEDFRTMMLP